MNETFFSVIIPTYNRAHLIPKAIESFIQQDYKNFEIILVDDGSTDNTEKVVKKHKDPKIKYFYQANSERGSARNAGLKIAKGDYINYFDSDDFAYKNHLKLANEIVQKNKHNIFHLGHEKTKNNTIIEKNNPQGNLNNKLIYGNILIPNSVFIKRKVAEEFKFVEDRKLAGSEDYFLWLQIITKYYIYGYSNISCAQFQHNKRSMAEENGLKTFNRQICFLDYLYQDQNFQKIYKNKMKIIESSSFLLVSLDYALEKKIYLSLKYLFLSLYKFPLFIFSKRPFAIIKNIIFH